MNAATKGSRKATQVEKGWENRIVPTTGMSKVLSGNSALKVCARLWRVSFSRANIRFVAPVANILTIRPVTTWFVRRETVR